MSKHLARIATALAATLAAGTASAVVITADDSWDGQGSITTQGISISACNTADAGTCSSPGVLGSRFIPDVGIGTGVQGQGNNEIDWYGTDSEMLRFEFDKGLYVESLQLGLLFDGPEYTDVQEAARFRVTYEDGSIGNFSLATLFTPAGGNATWNGFGSWSGTGLAMDGAGLWTGVNPFGEQRVVQIDMFAASGICGTTTECTDQSDYVFRSIAVPEPATLALLGAGLLGMGLATRRRKLKA